MRTSILPRPEKKYRPRSKKRIKVVMKKKEDYLKMLDINKIDFEVAYLEELNRVGNSSGDTFFYQEMLYNGLGKPSNDRYKLFEVIKIK